MSTDTPRIREASGTVILDDPLTAFFYLLMRDKLPTGQVADLILEVEGIMGRDLSFSNGWLARYAADCAERLKP